MSIHDHLMNHGGADVLVEQLGERSTLALLGQQNAAGDPIQVDAIVTHEQHDHRFDPTTGEYVDQLSRDAHVPLAELAKHDLAEIPPRSIVELDGLRYASGPARRTGVFLTVSLHRHELTRQHTNQVPDGPL